MKIFSKIVLSMIFSFVLILSGVAFINSDTFSTSAPSEERANEVAESLTTPSQVEYILSTGEGQYIDLGIAGSLAHKFEIKFLYCGGEFTSGSKYFFGASETDTFKYMFNKLSEAFNMTITPINVYINSNTSDTKSKYFSINLTTENDYYVAKHLTDVSNFEYDSSLSTALNYYLFAYNEDGEAVTSDVIIRIYGFTIYDNEGNVLKNYIPYQNENGDGCLYEEVSGELLENKGSGKIYTNLNDHFVEVEEGVEIVSLSENYEEYIANNTMTIHGNGNANNPYLVSNVYELIYALKKRWSN